MENTKEWYKSKTVWASLVTVVLGTLAAFGVTGAEGEQDAIVEMIMQTVVIITGFVGLYGRITAKSKITSPGSSAYMVLLCMMLLLFTGCQTSRYEAKYWQTVDEAGNAVEEPALERTIKVENTSWFANTKKTDLKVDVSDGTTVSIGESTVDPDEDAIDQAGDIVEAVATGGASSLVND